MTTLPPHAAKAFAEVISELNGAMVRLNIVLNEVQIRSEFGQFADQVASVSTRIQASIKSLSHALHSPSLSSERIRQSQVGLQQYAQAPAVSSEQSDLSRQSCVPPTIS